MSQDNTSVLGYAYSNDGIHIDYRCPEPIYLPREEFEQKKQPGISQPLISTPSEVTTEKFL